MRSTSTSRSLPLTRIKVDDRSWLDLQVEWVSGSDRLFAELVDKADWGQRKRRMYDKVVQEPRLTSSWRAATGDVLNPPILERMRRVLSERYVVEFDSVGMNLYRDGRDSVAWHRDHIKKAHRPKSETGRAPDLDSLPAWDGDQELHEG